MTTDFPERTTSRLAIKPRPPLSVHYLSVGCMLGDEGGHSLRFRRIFTAALEGA